MDECILEHVAYSMYLLNGLCAVYISLYFYRQEDDCCVRRLLIAYFLCFAEYQFAWGVNFFLLDGAIAIGTLYWYIANTPIVLANIAFGSYIIFRDKVCKR